MEIVFCGAIGHLSKNMFPLFSKVGRVVRWCWVKFQCRGIQHVLIWFIVRQGQLRLQHVRARLFGHFLFRVSFLSSFSLSLIDGPI